MEFNVYDMLVFEDESGNIYQDCVCGIDKSFDKKLYSIDCNNFTVFINKETNLIEKIYGSNKAKVIKIKGFKLKEIWTKQHKNMYVRCWAKDDPNAEKTYLNRKSMLEEVMKELKENN